MCQEYKFQQLQCGQCHAWHGTKQLENLQNMCRAAKINGGFGKCPKGTQKMEIRRLGWRDCENCARREKVHAMWTSGPALWTDSAVM